jgi:hypothetical protein
MAAGLSARFPWITPAGSVPSMPSKKLVDGGYFENSAVETAVDIIRLIAAVDLDRRKPSQSFFLRFEPC